MNSGTSPKLRFFNTATKVKEDFIPLDVQNVRMYVCGPTVYDYAHIGNARPAIVFDVLFRLLRHVYGPEHVTYVRNITDVDDKINARAARDFPDLPLNEAIRQLTQKTEIQYQEDMAALGCLEPTLQPRATEHIAEMIEMIKTLLDKGNAYVADGHVLFAVKSFKRGGELLYGRLARRSLNDMVAGARIEVAPYKRDPMDFVMWKPSANNEPGWDSPWGIGRPGWHIECSAMSKKYLGEVFDIHGGGIDLSFPHHENELAQSCCANGRDKMAQIWMHNGFLQVEGEKMSKSLGNFVTVNEMLAGVGRRPKPGEVIRLSILATHYRQPINFTEAKLNYWWKKLTEWISFFKIYGSERLNLELHSGAYTIIPSPEIVDALSDDLNFQLVITHLNQLASSSSNDSDAADELGVNLIWLGLLRIYAVDAFGETAYGARPDLVYKYRAELNDARALALNYYGWNTRDIEVRNKSRLEVMDRMARLNPVMDEDGVFLKLDEHFGVSLEPKMSASKKNEGYINSEVAARLKALNEKNWAEADRIRAELAAQGIQLMDYKDPETGEKRTRWEVKR